jgi:hypothetical protein
VNIPEPGDFLLTDIDGAVGLGVTAGQWLFDHKRTPFEHAAWVLDNQQVIEAMPGGAIISPLSKYYGPTREHRAMFVKVPLRPDQRYSAAKGGRSLEGVPYSFLDYGSIALLHWHIRPTFVKRYVESSKHLICSQLVDYGLQTFAGFHLFDDGRFHGDVKPSDLYSLGVQRRWYWQE